MNVVTVKFEESKGEWMGTRSVFLWGPGFPVELKDRQECLFFNLGCTGQKATVIEENCLSKCLMVQREDERFSGKMSSFHFNMLTVKLHLPVPVLKNVKSAIPIIIPVTKLIN